MVVSSSMSIVFSVPIDIYVLRLIDVNTSFKMQKYLIGLRETLNLAIRVMAV